MYDSRISLQQPFDAATVEKYQVYNDFTEEQFTQTFEFRQVGKSSFEVVLKPDARGPAAGVALPVCGFSDLKKLPSNICTLVLPPTPFRYVLISTIICIISLSQPFT